MQSNLDSFSMSGAISSDASSHPAEFNEPTGIADNVAEIAPDNSSLKMLATLPQRLPHMKELLGILPLDLWKHVHAHRQT